MKGQSRESEQWTRIVDDMRLREVVGEYGMDTLISKLSLQEDTGEKLVVAYPEDLPIVWVEVNYVEHIASAAERVLGGVRSIELVPAAAAPEDASAPAADASPRPEPRDMQEALLPLEFAEEATAAEQVEPLLAAVAPPAPRKRRIARSVAPFNSGLNEDYTFDNFVVGPNTEFAYSVARSLAEGSGRPYNPLFIYGASGLGKTHLLHAIGNAIRRREEDARVLYVTSEEFTNGYIAATASLKTLNSFRAKYRELDVLIMDDIQFLAKKGKTQDEFFHTFNTLFSAGKQIILSADCRATEVAGMGDRLTSRLAQGLSVTLTPPEYETRMDILRNKRRQWKSELVGDDVLDYLAKSITGDVRRLEGALTCISSFVSFSRKKLTVADARMQLQSYLSDAPVGRLSIKNIQQCVADEFHLRVADLNGRRRTANIAHPRQIAMFLARHHTNSSLQDIGAAFGGRDHGTVIHATRTIEQKMQDDADLRATMNRLLTTLGSGAM